MYIDLVVQHYQHSVSEALCVPVPPRLRKYIATILILRNPKFPRHFLNGYYVVFHENATHSLQDTPSLSPEEIVHSLTHGNSGWNWSRIPLINQQLPLTLSWNFLGWNAPPESGNTPSERITERSLVLSTRPSVLDTIIAGLACYKTQLLSGSAITDGSQYFSTHYPAKSALAQHETTLAWVHHGTNNAVGFIQYTSCSNTRGEVHTLITGLSVEEDWRRRGFACALLNAVISRVPSHEIWVGVKEENLAAASLYRKCGFEERKKQWGVLMKTVIS